MSNIKINDVPQRVQYLATGGQTQFTVPFPFFQNNFIYVWLNGVQLFMGGGPGQYTVSGAGSPSGGLVTFNTPTILNDIVTIEGIMPIDRTSIYSATISNLTGSDLNGDFNREVVMLQQLNTTQKYLQLQYAPWSLVSQDLSVTKDRYIPILGAQQVWRMNEAGDAIEPYTLDNVPAPSNSYFITYSQDPSLENEQNLGLLGDGLLKQTVSGGLATLAIAIPGVDYLDPAMPLGDMAYQNSNNVNITGGVGNFTAGQVLNSPIFANDLVNKAYADSISAGFIFKSSCYSTTTTNLSVTYNNGASGVGATLTATGNGVLAMDGVNPPQFSRVCITDQSATYENGIYVVTDTGSVSTPFILTRATDFDSPAEILPGSITFIQEGTLYGDTSFVETEIVSTVGTDPILFIQFSQTYPLSMGNGGTGANLTPTANGLVYSTASNLALLATANNGVLVTSAVGVPSISSTLPSGLTIPSPKINGIYDTNGNLNLQIIASPSAVNYIASFNSAAGNDLGFAAFGPDTNINFSIDAKGTGRIKQTSENTSSPVYWVSGSALQHTTNWAVPNTAASRTVTLQDADGTMAYLSDRHWVRIGTANASNSAAISFTGLTGYTNYMLVWGSLLPQTNGASLLFQGSINNGSTWLSSAPAYFQQSLFCTTASLTAGSDITTLSTAILSGALSNIATSGSGGFLVMSNLALTTGSRPSCQGTCTYVNTTPTIASMSQWFQINNPGSPVNAIRIFMSGGNILSGTVQLYGML